MLCVDDLPAVGFAEAPPGGEEAAQLPVPRPEEPVPRRMRISKEDLQEHGFTDGCKGCKAIIKKAPAQAHTETCRARMEKLLI